MRSDKELLKSALIAEQVNLIGYVGLCRTPEKVLKDYPRILEACQNIATIDQRLNGSEFTIENEAANVGLDKKVSEF